MLCIPFKINKLLFHHWTRVSICKVLPLIPISVSTSVLLSPWPITMGIFLSLNDQISKSNTKEMSCFSLVIAFDLFYRCCLFNIAILFTNWSFCIQIVIACNGGPSLPRRNEYSLKMEGTLEIIKSSILSLEMNCQDQLNSLFRSQIISVRFYTQTWISCQPSDVFQ